MLGIRGSWTRRSSLFWRGGCPERPKPEHSQLESEGAEIGRVHEAKAAGPTGPPRIATLDEIERAIETLDNAAMERLCRAAKYRLFRIGPLVANRREPEDLIQGAFMAVVEQRRHWYPEKVEFLPFLIGVIKSTASAWAGHHGRNSERPEYAPAESEIRRKDQEGNIRSPFDELPAASLDPENHMLQAEADREFEQIMDTLETLFADDEPAWIVVSALSEGMNGPEIQKAFGYTETEYRTIMRRIKRKSQKIMEKRDGK
jgi:RNA polymerase sigma factor (sigma-70 family)